MWCLLVRVCKHGFTNHLLRLFSIPSSYLAVVAMGEYFISQSLQTFLEHLVQALFIFSSVASGLTLFCLFYLRHSHSSSMRKYLIYLQVSFNWLSNQITSGFLGIRIIFWVSCGYSVWRISLASPIGCILQWTFMSKQVHRYTPRCKKLLFN